MTDIGQQYAAATARDTWWHCEFCGNHHRPGGPMTDIRAAYAALTTGLLRYHATPEETP